MDQTGALLGPLIVAAVLAVRGAYGTAFGVLLIPALLALGMLLAARARYPDPRGFAVAPAAPTRHGLPRAFWLYLGAAALIAAGYADFPLIAYHCEKAAVVSDTWIPIFYAVAMGVDALAALGFGWLFDRVGLAVVLAATLVSALFAPLVFLGGVWMALLGMALWGIGMGAQESIVRAAVAEMVPAARRGAAYGTFNAGFGVCWFLGSAAMGVLYDLSLPVLITVTVGLQLAALPVLLVVSRRMRGSDPARQ
jgi:MFS family permease